MQNADREAVRPTTAASATLNNSHRATAKHASMGLGVSSTGGGGGADVGPGPLSSIETDRVGSRFPSDGREDDGNADHMWKVNMIRMLLAQLSSRHATLILPWTVFGGLLLQVLCGMWLLGLEGYILLLLVTQ